MKSFDHPDVKDARVEFCRRIEIFKAELTKLNINADETCWIRSMDEQGRLYGQGRTVASLFNSGISIKYARPGMMRVTNAKPGSSPHNFGLAKDFVPVCGHRTFKVKAAWWLKFYQATKSANLKWGGLFKSIVDKPHVELPNWQNIVK
jgi:peptidoglycan L-alanyl-D-glutamate endopeptidase CwlK